jgi:hypothetical protein
MMKIIVMMKMKANPAIAKVAIIQSQSVMCSRVDIQ